MKYFGFLFFLIPFVTQAQSTNELTDICFIENSKIIILGTSNVTDYSCKLYDFSNNSAIRISSRVFGHTIKLKNAAITLKADGFDCNNQLITRDFYKAIKGDEFPEIQVQFHQFTLIKEVSEFPTQENVPSKISIVLAGQTNYYSTHLSSLKVSQDQLTIEGSIDLLMSDFDIIPPKALFGTIQTDNEISIDFSITFTFK